MKIFAQKLLVGRTFLANQTVTVEDGQITAIGGGGPADFSVWALTPGLVDLHSHGGQGFILVRTKSGRVAGRKRLDDLKKGYYAGRDSVSH